MREPVFDGTLGLEALLDDIVADEVIPDDAGG